MVDALLELGVSLKMFDDLEAKEEKSCEDEMNLDLIKLRLTGVVLGITLAGLTKEEDLLESLTQILKRIK